MRNYLRANGVGIDCAGAVQQALLDLRDLPPTGGPELGLRARLDEDLTHLSRNRHFQKLQDATALRPGNLVISTPPPTIRWGIPSSSPSMRSVLSHRRKRPNCRAPFPSSRRLAERSSGSAVASSFGWEGPQERTWIFDPTTGRWGDLGGQLFDDDGHGHRTAAPGWHSGPWDHVIEGMYRALVPH